MYVCNCTGITEQEVIRAIDAGACKWSEVHAHYGQAPRCGLCECEISKTIRIRLRNIKTAHNLPKSFTAETVNSTA